MKNHCLKTRDIKNPYEIWKNNQGWTWLVLKKYQVDDAKPYARWLCAVSSPFTYGGYDMGDCYVTDVKTGAMRTYHDGTPGYGVEAA